MQVQLSAAETSEAFQIIMPRLEVQPDQSSMRADVVMANLINSSGDVSQGMLQERLLGLAPDIRPVLEAAGVTVTDDEAVQLQELRNAVVFVRSVAQHMPLADTVWAVLAASGCMQHLQDNGEVNMDAC
jgi:hypothetical protein